MALGLVLLAAAQGWAQAPDAPAITPAPQSAPARPVRVQSVGHTVKDLAGSVAFYHEAFGFPITRAPGEWQRVSGIGGELASTAARVRSATLALPGTKTNLLLVQYKGVPGTPLTPRNSDAGACTLAITVKDVDRALRDARAAGATVVTKGDAPLALGPSLRLVFIKDPDGFFVELGSAPAAPSARSAADANAVSVRIGFTIADSDKAADFYINTLGMQFQPPKDFAVLKTLSDLIGVEDVGFKSSFADLGGDSIRLEFLQFRGAAAQSRWGQQQDPGTPLLVLAMSDVHLAASAIIAAGGTPLAAETRRGGGANAPVFLKDPNAIPLELVQAP